MPSKKTDAKAEEQHACPNCGYCPHCGRSDRQPPMIPAPYPVPVPARPWPKGPYWYAEPTIYSGVESNAVPRFDGQTLSINAIAHTC